MIRIILLIVIMVCSSNNSYADISYLACKDYLSELITLEEEKNTGFPIEGIGCTPLAFKYPNKIGVYNADSAYLLTNFENGYVFQSEPHLYKPDDKTNMHLFCLSDKALKETKIVIICIYYVLESDETPKTHPSCLDDPQNRKVGRRIVIDNLDEFLAKSKK